MLPITNCPRINSMLVNVLCSCGDTCCTSMFIASFTDLQILSLFERVKNDKMSRELVGVRKFKCDFKSALTPIVICDWASSFV